MNAPAFNQCVAALQTILQIAGLSMIANGAIGVDPFRAALPYSGYVPTSQQNAVAGDIVIQGDGHPGYGPDAGQKHVGICETNGCTSIISNASKHCSLLGKQPPRSFRIIFRQHIQAASGTTSKGGSA